MNIFELKRAKPLRMSNAYLRKVEGYIDVMISKRLYASKETKTLTDVTNQILKFLDMDRDFTITPYESPWLHPIDKTIEVYVSETETVRYSEYYCALNQIPKHPDGKYYSTTCYRNYTKANLSTMTMDRHREVYWKLGPLIRCPRCSNVVEVSAMVHNHLIDMKVDAVCDHKLKTWQNPRPALNDPIGGYHSHKNTWVFLVQKAARENSIPMGVEIEVHSSISNSRNGAMMSAATILKEQKDNNFYFEWDGSLHDGGFELITNPMTLEFHQPWWESTLKSMRKVCVGYNVEQQIRKNIIQRELSEEEEKADQNSCADYGIHITVSRKFISDAVITKLCKFFDDYKNKDFIWAIAQRAKMYGGYNLGSVSKPKAKHTLVIQNKKVQGGMDRRQPVNLKGTGFIEFRIFRSTLNETSFLKNLEFIDALITYLSQTPGVNVDHRTFIMWLSKNGKRYPNLMKYLKHPLFFVRGAGKVKNTWSDLLTNYKLVVRNDPLKEYGPKPDFVDSVDKAERSMI